MTTDGQTRFEQFRDMLRKKGNYTWMCLNQRDNLEMWKVFGPTCYVRVIAIVGEHGFDLFYESEALSYEEDIDHIKDLIG